MIHRKYVILAVWLIKIKGGSTGLAPIHVKITKIIEKLDKTYNLIGEYFFVLILLGILIIRYRIIMDMIRAITPPILFGIDRKIA